MRESTSDFFATPIENKFVLEQGNLQEKRAQRWNNAAEKIWARTDSMTWLKTSSVASLVIM
jgi:hypothetical protein